jgi:hypothetical protein
MAQRKNTFTRCLIGLPWPPLLAVLLVLLLAITVFVQRSADHRHTPRLEALSILVGGDTQGLFIPCGCAAGQPGGLARRAYLVKDRKTRGNVLYADLGNAPGGDSEYDRVKFAAILRAELAMGATAHNLGPAELRLGAGELRRLASQLKAPFVSTNVQDADGRPLAESLRLVEIGGRRVAVAGLVSPVYAAPDEYKILDPAQALTQALAEQPAYDSLLVLAYLPEDELAALAGRLPEKAVLVGPSSSTARAVSDQATAPATSADAAPPQDADPAAHPHGVIAGGVGRHGRWLVAIDFAEQAQNWTSGELFVAASLPDEPGQVKNLEAYHQELFGYDFPPEKTGLSLPLPPEVASSARMAGTQACRACHAAECAAWDASRHAIAWNALVNRGVHYDAACQRCHTTGYGWEGGFRTVEESIGAVSVGCESCHGPSLAHAIDPAIRTPLVASQQCTVCHNGDNSPGFDYNGAWPRIRHGRGSLGKEPPNVPLGRSSPARFELIGKIN